jgi:type II secretory pathway pseudopilin PulG
MTHDETTGSAHATPQPEPAPEPLPAPERAPDADVVPASEGAVMWAPPAEAPRRRRRWPWILLVLIVLALAGTAGGVWLAHEAQVRADAARALTAGQQQVIAGAIGALSETDDRIAAQRDTFRTDLAGWDADEAATAQWQQSTDAPSPAVANPGGGAMPGDDPTGRAFLDSIGATDVQVIFDAGPENCGYSGAGSDAWSYTAGGCYDTRYRNWLFLAWERGGEELVWPVFVHEAMHWYQYQQYYPLFLAADRAGVAHDAYVGALEGDASCRAVYVYGIHADEYEDSSSPCDVDGWYEGWLRDHLASLGVRTTEPVATEYEVLEVTRP